MELEAGLYAALLFARSDHTLVGAFAQQEPKGAKDDRLSGPCFTCNDVQTVLEGHLHVLDDSQILNL